MDTTVNIVVVSGKPIDEIPTLCVKLKKGQHEVQEGSV